MGCGIGCCCGAGSLLRLSKRPIIPAPAVAAAAVPRLGCCCGTGCGCGVLRPNKRPIKPPLFCTGCACACWFASKKTGCCCSSDDEKACPPRRIRISRSSIGMGVLPSSVGSGKACVACANPGNCAGAGLDTLTDVASAVRAFCCSSRKRCARRRAAFCAILVRKLRPMPIPTIAISAILKWVTIIIAKVKTIATMTNPPISVTLLTSVRYSHPPTIPPPLLWL